MHVYVHIIITPHGVIITPPLDLGGDGHGLSEQFRGGGHFGPKMIGLGGVDQALSEGFRG